MKNKEKGRGRNKLQYLNIHHLKWQRFVAFNRTRISNRNVIRVKGSSPIMAPAEGAG